MSDAKTLISYKHFLDLTDAQRMECMLVDDDPDELRMTVRPRKHGERPQDWSDPATGIGAEMKRRDKVRPILGTLKPYLVRSTQAPLPLLTQGGDNGGAGMTAAEERVRKQTEILRARAASALGQVIFNTLNENSEKLLVVQVDEPKTIGKITMEARFYEFVAAECKCKVTDGVTELAPDCIKHQALVFVAEAETALQAVESTIMRWTPEEHLFEALAPIRKLTGEA